MHVAMVSSEVVPFAKTGGLADVIGALAPVLQSAGHDVCVFMPYYRQIKNSTTKVEKLEARVFVPLGDETVEGEIFVGTLPGSSVKVYFLGCDRFYDREGLYGTPKGDFEDNASRFVFFSRGVVEALRVLNFKAEVVHVNDWQAGLIPVYLKTLYSGDPFYATMATLFTVHNMGYQGLYWHWDWPLLGLPWSHFNWKELEFHGKINFLKGGLVFADILNTVSPTYAQEIQTTDEFGKGLQGVCRERAHDLFGVINGIDASVWNPETDKLIPANFGPANLKGKAACKAALQKHYRIAQRKNVPVFGMIGRLDVQKGFDLIVESLDKLLGMDIQLVILGTGKEEYHKMLQEMAARYPRNLGVVIGFDNALAHLIEAGSDLFVMPSRYEPCGLNQLYSLRYGTVPLVRKTGGLADTIVDATEENIEKGAATGIVFEEYSSAALVNAFGRATELYEGKSWKKIQSTGMERDWSWQRSASEYVRLYELASERRKKKVSPTVG